MALFVVRFFGFSPFLTYVFLVFGKNTNAFSNLVFDVVFRFSSSVSARQSCALAACKFYEVTPLSQTNPINESIVVLKTCMVACGFPF